jgi:hypothetical protein
MTDPETILATICFTTAVAVPVGVVIGRKMEAESRRSIVARLERSRQALMDMPPITIRIRPALYDWEGDL